MRAVRDRASRGETSPCSTMGRPPGAPRGSPRACRPRCTPAGIRPTYRAAGYAVGGQPDLVVGFPASPESMIAPADRGLVPTCLWYRRGHCCSPGCHEMACTSWKKGEVVGVVNNFRFNDTPVPREWRTPSPEPRCRLCAWRHSTCRRSARLAEPLRWPAREPRLP